MAHTLKLTARRAKTAEDSTTAIKLEIDGHDVTGAVLTEGFRIEPHPDLPGWFYAHMTVRPDALEIDIDNAVILHTCAVADTSVDSENETEINGSEVQA